MPDFTEVNWLAVLLAAVAGVVIGFVWYMPAVFGKRWVAASGIEMPTGAVSPAVYVGPIVQGLLAAYVLALFAGAADIVGGIVIAAVIWIGFVATTSFNAVIFERRRVEYWAINAGYVLVSLLVMGAIIGFFPATM
ncbi:MAG TPA: DUF1761 domain-containing protein [Candidatus Limnocylindrales bacterium]|jgi:hypothetical protein|nr:DUF1761 domain-containing protein [Candidatus Limnocylindrales bacterium]